MSRIGRKPIIIPDTITVTITDSVIRVSNKDKQELVVGVLDGVEPSVENGELHFTLYRNTKQARSNWGTLRSLVNSAVEGLTKGFEKGLVLEGVGYRIKKEGNNLVFSLGFSHPVLYAQPEGIIFEVEGNNMLRVRGVDKALVGQVAADIRALKKVEPYKGKGFHYVGEIVRRKAGKRAVVGAE